jgi:hypothetical protein
MRGFDVTAGAAGFAIGSAAFGVDTSERHPDKDTAASTNRRRGVRIK